jgi:SAM-dependent methyltransferase
MEQPEIRWNWKSANYLPDWHEPIVELLARYVPTGSKVLEIGSGGSHTIGALAGRFGCSSFGIEPDRDGIAKTLELANAENAEVKMVCGDGFDLPFGDGEFDVVYSLGLIEHFTHEKSALLLKEHVRVCRRNGIVIIATPNSWNLPHTLRKWVLGSRYEFYPERGYTKRSLERLMKSEGLELICSDGLNPMWGVKMMSGGWRFDAVMRRLGIADRLERSDRSNFRSLVGYMIYSIARRQF